MIRRAAIAITLLIAAVISPTTVHAAEARIGLLTLEGPPGTERAVSQLAARAEIIIPQIESDLGGRFKSRFIMLVLPAGARRDSNIAKLDAEAPEWAAGYLIPERRIGAIRMERASDYPYGTPESVLAHEATHMLMHDLADSRVPLWFDEGVATWEGRKWNLEDAIAYSTSLLTTGLPPLAELDSSFHSSENEARLAYAASLSFVSRHLSRNPRILPELLRRVTSRPFSRAWQDASGGSLQAAEAAWRRDSLIRYRWLPVLTASSTLWIGITLLALVAGVRRRERMRRMREQWALEESSLEELTLDDTQPEVVMPENPPPGE